MELHLSNFSIEFELRMKNYWQNGPKMEAQDLLRDIIFWKKPRNFVSRS